MPLVDLKITILRETKHTKKLNFVWAQVIKKEDINSMTTENKKQFAKNNTILFLISFNILVPFEI